MFILKVAVNEKFIDEIHVINTGHVNDKGEHLYRIRYPEELNKYEIYHDRSKPWYYLAEKITQVLKKAHLIDSLDKAEDLLIKTLKRIEGKNK